VTETLMYRELGLQIEAMYDRNARTIRPLLVLPPRFLSLTLEVAAWVVALWRS